MQMESQIFRVRIHLMTRFMLVSIIIICCSRHASSGQASDSGKYITETYFAKHDSFIDSVFDNFIENDIPLGLNKVLQDKSFVDLTASILRRDVIGEGSHRLLSSSIRLKMQPTPKAELAGYSCKVVIIEKLPLGVFADPFELQHLVDRGVFSEAAVFGDTNLELPSFRSNQSIVEIHIDLGSKVLPVNEDDLHVNLELPIHARYPRLGPGYSRVEFGQPDLLLCYNIEKAPSSSCSFMSIDNSAHRDSILVWNIPCGIKEHAEIVSAITFGFAVVAALLIVLVSIRYSDSDIYGKLKRP